MPVKIHSKLQEELGFRGIKHHAFAVTAGIEPSFFSQIINGIRGVSIKNRQNIEETLLSYGFKKEKIKSFFIWADRKKRIKKAN